MKKRVLVAFLTIIMSLPFIKVNAGNMDSYVTWTLDMNVVAHQIRNGSEHMTNLALMKINDKVAYCIEPGVVGDNNSWYSSTLNIKDTSLGNIDTKRLSLIGYFGYGYSNHNTKEYYMATQELIWRLMGVDDVWWTDKKYNGNVLSVEKEKNEILNLVNNYEVSPSFNFKDKYIVGDEITLNDKNNVLSGYEVKEGENIKISGNNITIKVSENTKFKLIRKQNGKSPIYYYKNGFQTIGTFEYAYDYEKEYNLTSEYGKIEVNKIDSLTKSKKLSSPYATLKDAIYVLYDLKGNMLDEQRTNENGIATFNKLIKGTYYVQEKKASKGYTLDISRYQTYVATTRLKATINSDEKIIENKVIITKVLEDKENNSISPEKNIEFGLYYDDGTFINNYKTNENGIIELVLPYGKYILKQITKLENIDVAEDTTIEVIDNNIIQNITITNHKINKEIIKDENDIIKEDIVEEDTVEENIIEELPNTGKYYDKTSIITMLSLGIIIYIYEKKHI